MENVKQQSKKVIFMLLRPASWYPACAQRFVQFQCSRNFDSLVFQTHFLHSCRIPYPSLMCWVGRYAHHACPFDHFRTVCTIFWLVHSPDVITVRVHLCQFALHFTWGWGGTCFIHKKLSASRTSSRDSCHCHCTSTYPMHGISLTCAIYCILLQAQPPAEEQNTSLA